MGTNLDLTSVRWRRSSYSGNTGGECVEIADLESGIAIRDSKNPAHGILTLAPEAWAALVAYVRR